MRKTLGTAFALAFAAFAGTLYAQGVNIPQVPADSQPADNAEALIKAGNSNDTGDYQNQIMSDPNLNERARAEAVMKSNVDAADMDGVGSNKNMEAARGNKAVIIQNGRSNQSSITQKGENNTAIQTQNGNHNDLRVEQTGKNNRSVEHQKGNYNHKIKIQNGEKTEETTTDQAPQDKE